MQQKDEVEVEVRAKALREDSNALLGAGLGIGAIGALGGLVAGAVCPVCIVATPALLGAGVVQRVRASRCSARARRRQGSSEAPTEVVEQSAQARRQMPTGSR